MHENLHNGQHYINSINEYNNVRDDITYIYIRYRIIIQYDLTLLKGTIFGPKKQKGGKKRLFSYTSNRPFRREYRIKNRSILLDIFSIFYIVVDMLSEFN